MIVAEKLQGTKNGYHLRVLSTLENDIFMLELLKGERHPSSHFISLQDTINEMQDMIGAQKDELSERDRTIKELQEEHEKSLGGMINILRGLSIPEQEIIAKICEQYQIDEEQVRKYM